MTDETKPSIYEDLGVPEVINGMGTKTRLSGTRMRPAAADAMREAAAGFARISDLQARASTLIADVTGAEAGYVLSGAAAALTLAAAACIAGDDLAVMARLPETDDVPADIVIPRTHRNGYDHALRAAGATLVEVGNNDFTLGSGATNVERWELDAAIGPETVAVAYTANPRTEPSLETIVEVSHANDVPVIVDAASQLPPSRNLSRFTSAGADLVAFSGGKAIRGPQATGILAGREDLVHSVALQHLDMHANAAVWIPSGVINPRSLSGVPRQGLGRSMKVGKEEIVGLIRALEEFVAEDDADVLAEWHRRAERIAEGLASSSVLSVALRNTDQPEVVTDVRARIETDATDGESVEFVRTLRTENPRVYVGADTIHDDEFTVNPVSLTDEEADYLVDRVLAVLGTIY